MSLNHPNIHLKIKGDSCNGKNWSQIIFFLGNVCGEFVICIRKQRTNLTSKLRPFHFGWLSTEDRGLRISLTSVANNLLFNIQDTKSLWHLPSPFHSQTLTGAVSAVIELANYFTFWNADCLIMMGKRAFYSHKLRELCNSETVWLHVWIMLAVIDGNTSSSAQKDHSADLAVLRCEREQRSRTLHKTGRRPGLCSLLSQRCSGSPKQAPRRRAVQLPA